jgi:hypothetical protein
MNFPVFSQLAGNFGVFRRDPFFIDSKNSETSSHLTLPSSEESANHRFRGWSQGFLGRCWRVSYFLLRVDWSNAAAHAGAEI